MGTELNFGKALEIDKYNLDEELLQQALLYLEWSDAKAQAEQERDKAKEQLDLTRAELDISIRRDPKAFGLEKITEGAISNIILTQDKYQKAEIVYLEMRYSYNVISGALEALSHKKSALENLVKLFLNNYWAEAERSSLNRSDRLLERSKKGK